MQTDKPVLPEIEHLRGKLTDEQLEAIKDVLERNEEVFSRHKADIGCCNFVEHEIELDENAVPHREGARRMTPHKSEACRKEIETLLEYDMIEPSKSPWACGVVMAKKKGDQLRFCCDFRYLNSVTKKDAYPIPRIDESLSKLGDAKFFTTLDLGSAFWQVPLRKQDRDKTGFACELGLFQWKRMPFGLCNATATFQRLMAHALIGVTKKYRNLVMCYVDDVVIATPTLEDHIERLDEVFACMKRSGLKCKTSKCEILKDSIKYLGRMVDKHGIRPDPDAVEAVLTWKSPKTEHQLMSFLGFANYYREFIKGYADKVYPMQQLMRHKGNEERDKNIKKDMQQLKNRYDDVNSQLGSLEKRMDTMNRNQAESSCAIQAKLDAILRNSTSQERPAADRTQGTRVDFVEPQRNKRQSTPLPLNRDAVSIAPTAAKTIMKNGTSNTMSGPGDSTANSNAGPDAMTWASTWEMMNRTLEAFATMNTDSSDGRDGKQEKLSRSQKNSKTTPMDALTLGWK